MPKNKGKGGKGCRKGKKESEAVKRELIFKDECQEYAQVIRLLGNARLEANCFDGKKRQCTIRGTMRRKKWVSAGDIILVSLRDFQDDKADVIDRYTPEEARKLKEYKQLPDTVQISEADPTGGDAEDIAVFGAGDEGDEDDDAGLEIDSL
ncbi:Translation initiation factor 1A [Monocercomonoides exilis]|uniref:Translation initiation factor 1A n=1 Tax=Monocercomonoides exilis TaxID=2049356 RepID=UPI00355965A2|nr:Translation initiation factor 1A [Monocercomonoides exilis]|eukprot:MONOS_1888.1-p1 / transcript=MONOS_1888.1 / gene=MONOS_1888 / organism=Monocercomonoides_exilis_PA203 / gene_product=Translation initiation factor 1A / transcript_product=Translation initiation factor 1A / location=Mono_scaffold00036:45061-45659(+) / protein_length=151 / sequence_SO=supercontig / SO=protein_coding / is_pseudo=false